VSGVETCEAHTVCDAASTDATVGDAYTDTTCACATGFHTLVGGTSCTAHTVCDATSTDATVGSAIADVICACADGFHSIADVSGVKTCDAHTVCGTGTVASPGDATTDTTCACATGYHTLVGGTTCTENQCTCTNGIAATNTACPTDGDVKCLSCGTFFNTQTAMEHDEKVAAKISVEDSTEWFHSKFIDRSLGWAECALTFCKHIGNETEVFSYAAKDPTHYLRRSSSPMSRSSQSRNRALLNDNRILRLGTLALRAGQLPRKRLQLHVCT
jgi:hypothetical protein